MISNMDYEKLYNTYYMQVYSYIITLTRDRDIAEEITQNTFFKALSSNAEFKNNSSVLTWLCSISKNLFYDECRKNRRIAEITECNESVSDENIEASLENSDTAYRIHLILHDLEEPYKEVFQLRIFGELSFIQIASIFGKSENWARVTYHRARLKLIERMDKHE